jgi:filamentous hemagglutinin family protein
MMKSTWGNYWTTAIAIIAISPVLLSAPVNAQISAAQDGTNTVVLPNGQRFDITGGTQAGANLFHSFQQFGLSQGQVANFLSQPNIQNILGRVVGGDPSVINGLIQLTGGNSNLYIMNPAGVIFGSNASLNVPASFTATTANGIQVGNSWFGMNTIASDLKNLTGTPNAFAFTSPSTNIQNQTGVIVNQGNLNVSQGKSITLVGGIVINTGTIESPNGNINIVAVPDGKYVRITPEGGVLSFDLPIATQQELGNTTLITGVNLPKLLTGSGIVAPMKAGDAIASGNLTAANINVLANRYDATQASLNATNIQQGWNFVFIDSTIKNYQTLLDVTNGGSSVTMINPDQYGIAQVTATLASVTGANSLHIVSEGDVGNFWLGKDFVSTENIAKYANDLQAWKTSLSPAANILLYACNLASGENGVALVQAVKNYTGRDVAASIDITGSSKLGGNWNLEYQTGKLNTGVVFSSEAQNSYDGRLVTFTTTNINDAGLGSLRQAILDANALAGADTIRFDTTGVFATPQIINLTSATLNISQDLTVQGTGASNLTVRGNNTFGIFNITAGNVTFDGLTITNGRGGNGGGISNNSTGTLTVSNSNVSGNTATNFGGGIFNNNGTLTVSNSNVSGNTATNFGGGIFSNNGALTLTNSTVSGNTATSFGGGILTLGFLTITNSTISANRSTTQSAGGSYSQNGATITNSTFSGNTSQNFGGGVHGFGPTTITNTTVSGNTATNITGGGIYNGGTLTLTNSTVSGNTAGTAGGGINIEGAGALTVTNSTVSGNRANTDGGGIFVNVTGNTTITNNTITNNTADADNNGSGDGGGIFRSGGIITIANSIIAGNFDTPNNAGTGVINPDVSGVFVDGGNNLIGDSTGSTNFTVSTLVGTAASRLNPQLAPLANYGGTTQTHALLPNSPALDAGNNANAPVGNDQRGATRIFGSAVDIGAFESQGFSLTPLANTTPQSTNINTSFAQPLGVQVTENFVNAPIPAPNILVTFAPSSSSANGVFAGNTNVLTNQFGIALAPTFTANGIPGSYSVSATANGFKPITFSLTNKVAGGFGGVYPSREDLEGRAPRLDEQDLEVSFTKVLCLDPSLATAQITSIPTCKK